jgi:hypothetical protein
VAVTGAPAGQFAVIQAAAKEENRMKRFLVVAGLLALTLGVSGRAVAQNAAAAKPATLKGELVDTGCYLSHGAKGEKHIECATKCIANGMPMGLLTADGTVYLITMSHSNADPYNNLKTMAGKMVSVTGPLASRGGLKSIEADEVKPAATSASK